MLPLNAKIAIAYSVSLLGEIQLIGLTQGFYRYPCTSLDSKTLYLELNLNGDFMEWTAEAEARLKEIPFFVRPAARKKIEKFAQELGISQITIEVYEQAKQKFGSN
jgi:hypothetical protein